MQINNDLYEEAILIRQVEERFLTLFSQGKLNGTVHTCVGQELSALAFAGQIEQNDFIFSNHRCHGHYLAYTKDVNGLMAELLGKRTGTCGGIGSSQHLCKGNFFSNGIQGGIIPVSAGYALANKLRGNSNIGVVYIGDGTLGEGVLYETLNLISKWNIPLIVVCENNYYAQSTSQSVNLAGDITARADAFGVKSFTSSTSSPAELMEEAKASIKYVRSHRKPAFHLVDTARLNAHSKGDDDRDPEEIARYKSKDPIHCFTVENPDDYQAILERVERRIDQVLVGIEKELELSIEEYLEDVDQSSPQITWHELPAINERQVTLINDFFTQSMQADEEMLFIGEDVLSPYGGAFKVAQGLSDKFPKQVFSTPISEAAITGITNGLALNGMKPYVEIMFGDFVTLAFDQIVNHASKFHHMYNKQVSCPMVLRTPMGGGRGYGPTHSQTLDKFLIGIDNVTTVALSSFVDPRLIYHSINKSKHPSIVIENKLDYGNKVAASRHLNFSYEKTDEEFPIVRIYPSCTEVGVTIVTYGGMANPAHSALIKLFLEYEVKAELLVLSKISPLDVTQVVASADRTKRLFVVEETSNAGGFANQVIAKVVAKVKDLIVCENISALPVPIPSTRTLESQVLPSVGNITRTIGEACER